MFKQRRLVKYLNVYVGNKDLPWNNRLKILLGDGVPDTDLIVYLRDKKNFLAPKKLNPFRKIGVQEKEETKLIQGDKIIKCINDCLYFGYIIEKGRDKNNNLIKLLEVTPRGRDFMKIGGFFEEIIKRRKRTSTMLTTVLLSNVFVGGIIWAITYFWPYIKNLTR